MLEVIVKDTGVGIQEENLQKLFKLFGFLDVTKDLNTNGIGLGLHICKMIVEQFGGLITCKSKWGQGTSFIFLIALDNSEDTAKEANLRCRNPIKKVYMSIKVKEYNDDKFYDIFEENSFQLQFDKEEEMQSIILEANESDSFKSNHDLKVN